MRARPLAALGLLLTAPLAAQPPEEVRLRVSDERTLIGDVYRAGAAADAPAILLFHQGGGDARGEYADIIPRLVAEGFHVLSTDVRGGGTRFGGVHRAPPTGDRFRYCEAFADVELAVSLARASGLTGPLIAWGSSYTATLVVQLGARRSADVRAVLAFSPASGEPLSECQADTFVPWLVRARVPLLVVRPSAEAELPQVRAQIDRLAELDVHTVIIHGRGHGSSILVPARFEGDVTPAWEATLAFLRAARTPLARDSTARAARVREARFVDARRGRD